MTASVSVRRADQSAADAAIAPGRRAPPSELTPSRALKLVSLPDPSGVGHPAVLAPIGGSERIDLIDAIRGVAILGILCVNMMLYAHPVGVAMTKHYPDPSALDRAADLLIGFAASGKFFAMFSLLFGIGLSVQMQRAQARGVSFVGLYARRMLVLLVIGGLHGALLWNGDILASYAVFGLVLLLFRNLRPRALLAWAVGLLAVFLVVRLASLWMVSAPDSDALARHIRALQDTYAVYGGGGFLEITAYRAAELPSWFLRTLLSGPMILAMFLIGVAIGQRGLLYDVAAHARTLRRLTAACLALGVAFALVYILTSRFGVVPVEAPWRLPIRLAAYSLGSPLLCVGYVAGLALLWQRQRWRRWLGALTAVGRMALTNYLLQSLICTTLFYGYGFGLYGAIGPAAGLALTAVIFAVQIALSRLWQARYRFGPLEWLWRALTYGTRPTLRRRGPATGAGASA